MNVMYSRKSRRDSVTDEQLERWRRELEKEEPKEWGANSMTIAPSNMFGSPKPKSEAKP